MSTILQLAPQNVWKHFYSLTQIPRPSGHMEKITKKHLKNKVDGNLLN